VPWRLTAIEALLSAQHRSPALLAGPPLDRGPESLASHLARLGEVPRGRAVRDLIDELEASGLLGRGGAGFPVGRKWQALAERASGRAVVLANGAEGEPASHKDRTLMATRPHLLIDGAVLAAEAVGADEIVFYIGTEHVAAIEAMRRAIEIRRRSSPRPMRLVQAPVSYVAGEATAAVHYVNSGDARPTTTPPRMSEVGVGGRPTLVQNVESLAQAALIARFGAAWYRSLGRRGSAGTALVTVTGAVPDQGVHEIALGTTLAEVVEQAGGLSRDVGAVILGGYFGTWARAGDVWDLALEPGAMKTQGLSFGCGIVGLLPAGACGVAATARIMAFLADASAGQCGPCLFGLQAISDALAEIAAGRAEAGRLDDIERWTRLVEGRGACRHPDGAAQLMTSAFDVFGADLAWHARTGRCAVTGELAAEVA
jgi:NADH:ubiquinone oxidoreductase subunit F (NADH-binding)